MTVAQKCNELTSALEKAPFFFHLLLAVLSGIFLAFAQAPTYFWFLLFPCFGLFYLLHSFAVNKKQVFILTFCFAVSYFVTGLNWIGNALLVEGNEYRWVWPIAVIALPTLLASFTALFSTIAFILFRKGNLIHLAGLSLLLTASEFARGYAFTGFPWNLYGYAWGNVLPIMQSLSIIGPYGLTFLTVSAGCSAGYLVMQNSESKKILASTLAAVAVVLLVFGFARLKTSNVQTNQDVLVHIVQPNIAQADKWKPAKLAQNFEKHIELSFMERTAQKNIIIWPETAIPPSFFHSVAVEQRMETILNKNTILLTGALAVTPEDGTKNLTYHNSLALFSGTDAPRRLYSKSHLVPLGEYIPFQKYIPLKPVVSFIGFERGKGSTSIDIGGGYPLFSPLICYEIIFPHQAVNRQQPRPDYILTVTNDGWYGDSAGPHQHFEQARFRAIEQGIPVVRSANTGISGLIDPYGRVIEKAELLQEASISAFLPVKTDRATFYAKYGDKPLFLLAVLLLAFLIKTEKKRAF